MMKDYQTALKRNLLAKENTTNGEWRGMQVQHKDAAREGTTTSGMAYSTVAQMTPANANKMLLKKLYAILAKVDEESNETKSASRKLKDKLGSHYEETKQQVEAMEMKFEELVDKVSLTLQNTGTVFLDPTSTKDVKWRMYWQEKLEQWLR